MVLFFPRFSGISHLQHHHVTKHSTSSLSRSPIMDTSEQVYTGFWTNWEQGRVVGSTLTLRNGAYLVAFLALFVRIVGSHFWRLLCYAIFHYMPSRMDELDRSTTQQKAILRNSYSPLNSVIKFVGTWVPSARDLRPKHHIMKIANELLPHHSYLQPLEEVRF